MTHSTCFNVGMTTTPAPAPALFAVIEVSRDNDTAVFGPFASRTDAWAQVLGMLDDQELDVHDEDCDSFEIESYVSFEDYSLEVTELIPGTRA